MQWVNNGFWLHYKRLEKGTFHLAGIAYHSWERGLNENTNGLLRRFFPKGMAIAGVPELEIEQAQFMINIRPRKTQNYLSPYEYITGIAGRSTLWFGRVRIKGRVKGLIMAKEMQ